LQTLKQLNAQLAAHERLSHFVLVSEAWTVDNGCMTPTMKIRRNVLEARFADQLAALDAKQPLHWQ
jgi:long-chain acyl-CoA synthetase